MNINITVNLWLWLLCGRSTGFKSQLLNTGIRYSTVAPSDDAASARALLRLDDTESDIYVMGAMAAALEVAQILRILPAEQSTTFNPATYHVAESPTVMDATAMPPTGMKWPSLRNFAQGLPIATGFTIAKGDTGNTAVVTDNYGRVEVMTNTGGGETVIIPELAARGVDAAFAVPGWQSGASFTLTIPPTRYPYASVAASIVDPKLIALMLRADTLETFVTSLDPVRKVGALACAIMRDQYQRTVATGGTGEHGAVMVTVAPDAPYDVLAGFVAHNQLGINWSALFLDDFQHPLTYTDADYDPDA